MSTHQNSGAVMWGRILGLAIFLASTIHVGVARGQEAGDVKVEWLTFDKDGRQFLVLNAYKPANPPSDIRPLFLEMPLATPPASPAADAFLDALEYVSVPSPMAGTWKPETVAGWTHLLRKITTRDELWIYGRNIVSTEVSDVLKVVYASQEYPSREDPIFPHLTRGVLAALDSDGNALTSIDVNAADSKSGSRQYKVVTFVNLGSEPVEVYESSTLLDGYLSGAEFTLRPNEEIRRLLRFESAVVGVNSNLSSASIKYVSDDRHFNAVELKDRPAGLFHRVSGTLVSAAGLRANPWDDVSGYPIAITFGSLLLVLLLVVSMTFAPELIARLPRQRPASIPQLPTAKLPHQHPTWQRYRRAALHTWNRLSDVLSPSRIRVALRNAVHFFAVLMAEHIQPAMERSAQKARQRIASIEEIRTSRKRRRQSEQRRDGSPGHDETPDPDGAPDPEKPDADAPNAETPDFETPDFETLDAETADGEIADGEIADAERADAEIALAKIADAKTPITDQADVETPAEKKADVRTPIEVSPDLEKPDADRLDARPMLAPLVDTDAPSVEAPHSESPHSESPHSESPASESPHSEPPHSEIPHSEPPAFEKSEDVRATEDAEAPRPAAPDPQARYAGRLSALVPVRAPSDYAAATPVAGDFEAIDSESIASEAPDAEANPQDELGYGAATATAYSDVESSSAEESGQPVDAVVSTFDRLRASIGDRLQRARPAAASLARALPSPANVLHRTQDQLKSVLGSVYRRRPSLVGVRRRVDAVGGHLRRIPRYFAGYARAARARAASIWMDVFVPLPQTIKQSFTQFIADSRKKASIWKEQAEQVAINVYLYREFHSTPLTPKDAVECVERIRQLTDDLETSTLSSAAASQRIRAEASCLARRLGSDLDHELLPPTSTNFQTLWALRMLVNLLATPPENVKDVMHSWLRGADHVLSHEGIEGIGPTIPAFLRLMQGER